MSSKKLHINSLATAFCGCLAFDRREGRGGQLCLARSAMTEYRHKVALQANRPLGIDVKKLNRTEILNLQSLICPNVE